ncbi:MAG: class I SAM-dependent methyltransferase, partial [Thermoproteota archaeon]
MGVKGEQERSVIQYYGKAAGEYDKEYDTLYFKKLYDKITWRYIEPYLPKSGVVLDAGGGTGKWTIPMVKKGLKVVLYDISREMLNVARLKIMGEQLENMVVFKEGDICEIDFPENHFNFVLAEGDPISYCSNPDRAVGELARVL